MIRMKCVAVCQTVLVARNLHQALAESLDLDLIVKDSATARRLHDVGVSALVADPRRVDSYLKADVGPTTCVIVEDDGRHSLRRILHAIVDAGATLVYVLSATGQENSARTEEWRRELPDGFIIELSPE